MLYTTNCLWCIGTPLHRVASTAKEKGSGVRFRGVVSAERYKKWGANYLASCPRNNTIIIEEVFYGIF